MCRISKMIQTIQMRSDTFSKGDEFMFITQDRSQLILT